MQPSPFASPVSFSRLNRRRSKRHPYTIPAAALAILSAAAAIIAAASL